MYDKLIELINTGDMKEALYEFQEEYLHIDDRSFAEAAQLCVLGATIWESIGDSIAELRFLTSALWYDYSNYEIYYMLGLYYRDLNVNKAFLCAEMALFYCRVPEDRPVIEQLMNELKGALGFRVRRTSIMILSYNDLDIMKKCFESIDATLPKDSFEVVVVDNASPQEGVIEFLRKTKEEADYSFTLIESDKNLGFPAGCNLGYRACNGENDIFFLNNDTVLMPNSLFWLRMALYEDRNVGATGAMSNSATMQQLTIPEDIEKTLRGSDIESAIEAFKSYETQMTVTLNNPYISVFRLTGFALLLSRDAAKTVEEEGCIFDELFTPGYFEDDDLGLRLARAGYRQYICKNSRIYHRGGTDFEDHREAMEKSRQKFIDKWGFDCWGFFMPETEVCDEIVSIAREIKGTLRVIDLASGFGANASYLKQRCSNIYVACVCTSPFAAGIARMIADDVIFGDSNIVQIPWPENSFDIVIADRESVSDGQIMHCLRPGGRSYKV